MKLAKFNLKIIGILFVAIISAATVRAVPITYNFDGSGGLASSYTFTSGGITVTATATSWDGSTWRTASVGQYSGGLGITNSSGVDGNSPQHTVDNNGWKDYLILQFSAPVDVRSVSFGWVFGDSDFSYWTGSSLASVRTTAGGTSVAGGSFPTDYNINGSNATGSFFSIAASLNGRNDYFKVDGLTVDYTGRVPDRGNTLMLLGIAAMGLLVGRKRFEREGYEAPLRIPAL